MRGLKRITRRLEAHPLAWRVILIILCIFIVGYVGRDDHKYYEQMRQLSRETL